MIVASTVRPFEVIILIMRTPSSDRTFRGSLHASKLPSLLARGITLNDIVGPLNNAATASLRQGKWIVRCLLVIIEKSSNPLWRCPAEAVDGLIIVSGAYDLATTQRDKAKDLKVACVQILVLINDQQVKICALQIGMVS
jgi:hypothetical protein